MESVSLFGTTFFYKKTSDSGPQEMAFRDGDRKGNKFFVHLHRMGMRLFGSYKTLDEFLPVYNDLPAHERYGFYEQIRSNAPRRHYFDIEWITPPPALGDKEDNIRIVDDIHERFVEFVEKRQPGSRNFVSNVVATDGSRPINGGTAHKWSFHLVYPMAYIVDQPTQKRIMASFRAFIQDDDRCFYTAPSGSVVCRIDFSVYSANRVMRMPLSSKHPGEEPLLLHQPCQMFRNYFITDFRFNDGSEGGIDQAVAGISLTLVDDDTGEVATRKRRRVGLPSTETESTELLTGEKRDFLCDVLRRTWNLVDVRFKHVAYSDLTSTFVVNLEASGDRCPIHSRVHEREHMFLVYVPSKSVVQLHCWASERDSGIDRNTYLKVNASLPIFEDTDPVPFKEIYNEPQMRPYRFRLDRGTIMAACTPVLPYACSTLLVQGQMGVGKTKALYSFLRELDPSKSVLFITYRVSLADKYAADLKEQAFLHYRRDPFRTRDSKYAPRYVTCFDSVTRFDGTYDYIVLDEVDSVLMHCGSPYMRLRDSTLAIFAGMLRRAGYVIGLDAHISSLVYAVMERLRTPEDIRAVKNEYRRPCDRVAYVCEEPFVPAILAKLRGGRSVAVCSTTKAFTEDLAGIVRKELPDKRIVIINSDRGSALIEDEGETKLEVSDVDSWTKADLLVYSPSISAGVSFEKAHFDALFVYVHISSFTPLVTDLLQMMARVRILVSGEVYIYFKTRDLSVTKPEAIEQMPMSAAEVVEAFNAHDAGFVLRLMGTAPPPPCDDLGRYSLEDWRTMLYVNIVLRRIKSNAYFETLMYERLSEMGYEIRHVFSASATTDEEAARQRKEAADAIAELKRQRQEEKKAELEGLMGDLRGLFQEHGIEGIDDGVLQRWLETPQRLRNLPALSELLTASDVEAWIADHDAAVAARVRNKDTVGGKHAVMDGAGPRMSWALKAMAELFGYRDEHGALRFKPSFLLEPSFEVKNRELFKLRDNIHEYVTANPLPKSGTKRALETDGDKEHKAPHSVRILRTLATEIGFDFYRIDKSTRVHKTVIGAGDWQQARKILADAPLYEKLVYRLFKERIDRTAASKLKPERLAEMTPQDLGRWFVGGCHSDF